MVKASIIITEKKSVSKAIAKALFPSSFDERDNCKEEHSDIISLRNPKDSEYIQNPKDILCFAEPYKNKEFFYFCSNDCVKGCQFTANHIDSMGMDHAAGTRRKLRYQNKSQKQGKIIFEEVTYYVFNRNGEKVVITDTQGNPFSYLIENIGERQTLETALLRAKDWDDLEKALRLKPSIEFSENRAYKARERMFNNLLVKRRLPDGTPIELSKVIAATDFDIAGSYIFYLVIENANQFVRFNQRNGSYWKEIPAELLSRMKFQSMKPEEVLHAFENPIPFDFENARAGEIRALFDFLYGTTLTSKMKTAAYAQQAGFRASIGRNRFIGLRALIEESANIEKEEESYIYLVFNGLKDKDGIREDLESGNYTPLRINQKRARITASRLIRDLKKCNIGTHTTRCKLPKILVDLGLAQEEGYSISPTEFGISYYSALFPHLEMAGFSISEWNRLLNSSMDVIRTSCSQDEKVNSERMKREFMNSFLYALQQHLAYLSGNWKGIIEAIPPRAYPKKEEESAKRGDVTLLHKGLLLEEADSVLSLEQISEFMSPETNKPIGGAKIYRHIKPTEASYKDAVRRVCCIDREDDFEIIEGDGEEVQKIEDNNCTVFRAEVHDNRRVAKYSKAVHMDNYEKLEIPELPKAESAHEPLYLTSISPPCVNGKKGFMLVREYNLPWMLTRDKLEKQRQGLINLASFSIGRDRFERVERYDFGKAHNFESLLIAMFEKYGVSFRDTAEMAEELYLGGA